MGLRVIFGAIITVALCTWCGLLYSVFASEISQPNPPDPCAGVARVLWSSRVVLRTETVPAAIHVGADGRIAEVRAAVTRAAAAQWASRELRLPPEGHIKLNRGVIRPGADPARLARTVMIEAPLARDHTRRRCRAGRRTSPRSTGECSQP